MQEIKPMNDSSMNRKEFLSNMGKVCVGACVCAAAGGLTNLRAEEPKQAAPPAAEPPRSEARINFAEGWVKRFLDAVDGTLDKETRKKLLMANGKACYLAWIADTKQTIQPVTLERFRKWITENVKDGSYRIDGNAIYFQYMNAAETGQAAAEGACLCPLVESKPNGLSSTYCQCSIGYVKAMHELLLNRTVEVELVDSVLMGGKRCQFKLMVA
jgi:hypothetical protein